MAKEGSLPNLEAEQDNEKPLQGLVYVCIGASRPDKSIGGPTAIALAQAGADVYIVGGDPAKERKADKVLAAATQAGSQNSARGTFDVSTPEGRDSLLDEIASRYGKVDGVLYYPAGGLMGENDEERLTHGTKLNITAPVELAKELLERDLIKEHGIFQMAPSIYSWTYPVIKSPDPRYDTVAMTKREGELQMFELAPKFKEANVSLVYTVGHGIKGTFSMNWMMSHVNPELEKEVLSTADVDGKNDLPTIDDMANATVSIAKRAKDGELDTVHIEYIGIAQDARLPLGRK